MRRDSLQKLGFLILILACLPVSPALANAPLPWLNAQTRGLDYQPYFLSAITEPVFDAGSNPGTWPAYGYSVALDRDWLLVGVPDRLNASGQRNGAVFLYQRQGTDWVQRDRIQFASGGEARCGYAVALNGNIAVIGCPFHSSAGLSERGRVLIYRLNPAAGELSLEASVLGTVAGERCGHAVATDGSGFANSAHVAFGCPGRGAIPGGGSRGGVSAYRYALNPGNQTLEWQPWGTLSPDAEGNPQFADWRFGAALSMERVGGDAPLIRLLVGMPGGTPDNTLDGGLAFLFERPTASGSWTQASRFARPGGSQDDAEFGFAVGLAGNRIAIGAPGAGQDATAARAGMVYRYNRVVNPVGGGWIWLASASLGAEMAHLNPSGGGRFGHAVALSASDLWVGQPFPIDKESLPSVWRYGPQRLLTDIHQGSLVRQGVMGEELGFALGVDRSSNRIAVGAPESLLSAQGLTGLAFVYEPSDRRFTDRFSPDHLRPGGQFRDCPDCPTMVMIPAGSFTQGSPANDPGSLDRERPQRQVSVPAFAVGQTEVSFAQWDACVADGGCSHVPGDGGWGRGDRPVIAVSWDDVQEYLSWLSNRTGQDYRLLSESEWEYAARAGTTARFNTGDCISTTQANYRGATDELCLFDIDRQRTLPVASFAPNAFGLYDMHGNVWELVQDCWNENYLAAPTDGSAWITGDCSAAIIRGGSWFTNILFVRSAQRTATLRSLRNNNIGFRVARSVSP